LVTCYLGLGSNMGDRAAMIARAVRCLGSWGDIVVAARSPMYVTRPWGLCDQRDFVNAVVRVETDLTPQDLLARVKSIETSLGRRGGVRWGPRPIDVDILFYGDRIVTEENLTIPHPLVCTRAFVLAPLVDVAPDLVHPGTGLKICGYLETIVAAGETSWRSLVT
jgi:2-amino-4-hydroxy-6-hydroxymethyldihydropteridine diphosphokinase